ncbi:acyltransferase family protein [Hymenobacter sp. BT491]|uniref:acyltransferase family protein n=1 Tax=Hymenobacter sp. BT491 TaxID=2766779 RepID=UPI00292A3E99|nr:heparan-alpha-glucosaminide N-acetyltransferase domain-containing protein [Hymenobacter sp. BT491]
MQSATQDAQQLTAATPIAEASGRLLSLDVFRGMAVLLMLLVNNPGDWNHYVTPFKHVAWNGCRAADLVYPAFLFIVGVSLVYALDSVRNQPERHNKAMLRVVRRAVTICLIGLLISLLPHFYFTSFRIPGVLQRIAVVYLVCSLLFLKTTWRTQAWLTVGILLLYSVLLQVVPVPGIGPANLEPSTNLGAWLDRLVFGKSHLFDDQKAWDPEGLLSTLPAIGTGLLGMLTARWLRRRTVDAATKVAWLFVAGGAGIVLGMVWNGWFPINKNLWTSSFVLYVGGISIVVLAALYWLCDVQGYRGAWTKIFLVCGVNALPVFFFTEALERLWTRLKMHNAAGEKVYPRDWLYDTFFVPTFSNPYHASLAWALLYTAICVAILWVLYRRHIIIKV